MQKSGRIEDLIRDLLTEIEAQIRGMWRFRWRAIIMLWLISIIAWYFIYSMPNMYMASARILVDTDNAIYQIMPGVGRTSDVLSEVNAVTREMLSRPNLAEVARKTDLDLRATTDAELEDLLASLRTRISVNGNRDHIYSISYQDPDRQKAVAVVDSLVETFVEESLGGNRSETNQAQAFLQQQIDEYEARLTEAEDRLAAFKTENVAVMPGQGGDYYSRLQGQQKLLAETESKLSVAVGRRAELMRQIEGEEPVFGIMSTVPSDTGLSNSPNAAKIAELEAQLGELRLRYTDKHPQIGQLLDTIQRLRDQDAQQAAASIPSADSGLAGNPLDLNPVYQNMRIQLSEVEVEVASLTEQRALQRRGVMNLQDMLDTIPKVEAEYGRLNRDYDVVQAKYEQLLQQLESANIGENVELSIDDVQFRIIEPPFASRNPVGPKRQLFLAASFVAALGLSVAIMFALNVLHPVFSLTDLFLEQLAFQYWEQYLSSHLRKIAGAVEIKNSALHLHCRCYF